MSVRALLETNEKTYQRLNKLTRELDCDSPDKDFLAFRTVLHALRDRLTIDKSVHFAAQMPMLIRGCYHENWNLQPRPTKVGAAEMMASIAQACPRDFDVEPPQVVRAFLRVITRHVSKGEIEDVKACLPKDLRELWPACIRS